MRREQSYTPVSDDCCSSRDGVGRQSEHRRTMDAQSNSWAEDTYAAFTEALSTYPVSADYLADNGASSSLWPTNTRNTNEVVRISACLAHVRLLQSFVQDKTGVMPTMKLIVDSVQEVKSKPTSMRYRTARRSSPLSGSPMLGLSVDAHGTEMDSPSHTSYDSFQSNRPTADAWIDSTGSDDKLSANFSRRANQERPCIDITEDSEDMDPFCPSEKQDKMPDWRVTSSPYVNAFGNMSIKSPDRGTPPSMSRRRLAANIPALQCQVHLPPPSLATRSSRNTPWSPSLNSASPSTLRNLQLSHMPTNDLMTPIDQIIHTPLQPPEMPTEKGEGRWRFPGHGPNGLPSPFVDPYSYSNLPSPSMSVSPSDDSNEYSMSSPSSSSISPIRTNSSNNFVAQTREQPSLTPLHRNPFLRKHTPTRPVLCIPRKLSYSQAAKSVTTPDRNLASPYAGCAGLGGSGLASPLVIRTPGLNESNMAESPMMIPSGLRTYFD